MAKNQLLYSLAAGAMVFTLGACSTYPTQRTDAQYADDATINTSVQAAVTSVPGVHANTMQVTTYNQVVNLRGRADSQEAAQNAVDAARHVSGVKSVDYDIQVD